MLKQTTKKIQLISNERDFDIKKIDTIKHQLINNLERMKETYRTPCNPKIARFYYS